ncbi:MAG: hypothetical protein U0Q16_09060 [Bryobacteraceae bacterium]
MREVRWGPVTESETMKRRLREARVGEPGLVLDEAVAKPGLFGR